MSSLVLVAAAVSSACHRNGWDRVGTDYFQERWGSEIWVGLSFWTALALFAFLSIFIEREQRRDAAATGLVFLLAAAIGLLSAYAGRREIRIDAERITIRGRSEVRFQQHVVIAQSDPEVILKWADITSCQYHRGGYAYHLDKRRVSDGLPNDGADVGVDDDYVVLKSAAATGLIVLSHRETVLTGFDRLLNWTFRHVFLSKELYDTTRRERIALRKAVIDRLPPNVRVEAEKQLWWSPEQGTNR